MLPTLRFGPVVPSRGFRWVYKNDENVIELRDPPADWPAADYECLSFDWDEDEERPEPVLCDRYFLTMSTGDFMRAPKEAGGIGTLIEPRDLYLRFASERPTPEVIKAIADQYGLLNTEDAWGGFDGCKGAQDLSSAFEWGWFIGGEGEIDPDQFGKLKKLIVDGELKLSAPPAEATPLFLAAESASEWLMTHSRFSSDIKKWNQLKTEQNNADIFGFVGYLNEDPGIVFSIYLNYDGEIEQIHAEPIVLSLHRLIDIQFRMSIASNVTHRQCVECTKWMAIHPGAGRPEKQYCSDACRMRAYRKRKAASRAT